MYPPEASFTAAELEIIFRIRSLIGDDKETFIDDVSDVSFCSRVLASGTIYELEEPKGFPLNIYVDGVEFTSISGAQGVAVIGNKYLQFTNSTPVLTPGTTLLVIYEHFRNSDLEILNFYDTGALTFLVDQCNLDVEDLGVDLLVLSTAYGLLSKDLNKYIKDAVSLEDSDSKFDASRRPQHLKNLMTDLQKTLKDALESKASCKMMSLPVYKVE